MPPPLHAVGRAPARHHPHRLASYLEIAVLLTLCLSTLYLLHRLSSLPHGAHGGAAHTRPLRPRQHGGATSREASAPPSTTSTTTRRPRDAVAQRVADAFRAPAPRRSRRDEGDDDGDAAADDLGDADPTVLGAAPMDDEAERERAEAAAKARAAMDAARLRGESMPELTTEDTQPSGRNKLKMRDLFVHQGNWQKLLGHYADENGTLTMMNVRSLPRADMRVLDNYNFSSCAVVGNSGSLLNATYGASIDSHDIVLRLNQAPPGDRVNKLTRHVGARTTFRLINTRWANKYGDLKFVDGGGLPLEEDVTLVVTRARPKAYDAMAQYLKMARSDVTALYLSSRVVGRARQLLLDYRRKLEDRGFGPFYGGSTPSSGFVGVYLLLQMCGTVTVYGFGLDDETSGAKHAYHYFYLFSPSHSRKKNSMNRTHSFDLERALLRALVDAGIITFCAPKVSTDYNPSKEDLASNRQCGMRPKSLRAAPQPRKDDLFLEGADIKPVVKRDAVRKRSSTADVLQPYRNRAAPTWEGVEDDNDALSV